MVGGSVAMLILLIKGDQEFGKICYLTINKKRPNLLKYNRIRQESVKSTMRLQVEKTKSNSYLQDKTETKS